jgi:transposase
MDRESLRLLLAQGLSVEKIAERFDRHPTTISYWMRRYGLEKRFEVNASGAPVSLEAPRTGAAKCVLLGSNCHAEVQNGVTHLGARVRANARVHP